MNARHMGFGYAILLLLMGVTACSDNSNTAPDDGESFDAATAQAGLDAVSAAMATPVWESFGVLGERLDANVIGSGLVTAALGTDSERLSASELAQQIGRAAGVDPDAAPRIPDDVRGTTFVFDPDQGRYVADADRSGAPDNGIRFIIYAVNPVTREPIVDQEIGHADLTDLEDETENGFTLRFEVVSDRVTYLDYTVSIDGTDTSGSLSVNGFVSNGNEKIDFEVDVRGTDDGDRTTQDVTFQIDAADHLSASATVHGSNSAADAMGEVNLTVEVDDTEIMLEVDGSPDRIDATITLNGKTFATVSGNPRNPDIRSADGRPLRPDERQALHQMLQLVDNVFRMFNHLMQPVAHIVGLSMIEL